jgi:tetratricopeptide (TPR) repeat protein
MHAEEVERLRARAACLLTRRFENDESERFVRDTEMRAHAFLFLAISVAAAAEEPCGVNVRAADVEQLRLAKAALERGDAENARELASHATSMIDAHVVASNALVELGDLQGALAELKQIETSRLPCVAVDRVLFNEGNIVAEMEGGDPIPYYERALRIAESADIRNNLGQFLLKRGQLDAAERHFRAAINAPRYDTKQYAYLGLAKIAVARGSAQSAAMNLRLALRYGPWNREALDFAASLAMKGDAVGAMQLVSTALQSLPHDFVAKHYASAFEAASARLRDESLDVFQIKLAEWNGDFDRARTLAMHARPSAALAMIEAELAARSGSPDAAQKFVDATEFAPMASSTTPMIGITQEPWETAVIEQSASAYRTAALANGRIEDANRATTFIASLDSPIRDPWTLPLNRRFEDFASLNPKHDPNVFGSSNLANSYVIDGVSSTSAFFDTRNTPALDTVQEFVIATTSLSAEAAHLDNAVPLPTKGIHGEVEGQLRPASSRADAKPIAVPAARREHLDGRSLHANAGGEIVPERLWFFGDSTLGTTRGKPLPDSPDSSRLNRVQWLTKMNFTPQPKVLFNLSIDRLRDATRGVADDLAGSALGTPSVIGRNDDYSRTRASLNGNVIVNDDLITDARAEVDETKHALVPASAAGNAPQIHISDGTLAITGGIGVIEDSDITRTNTFAWNISGFSPRHSVRAGAWVQRDRNEFRDRLSGNELVDATRGTTTHSWQPSSATESSSSTTSALYIQDSFAPTQKISLQAGVRWTRQTADLAARRKLETSILQPRLQLTLDPSGVGLWNVHAGVGRFSSPLTPYDLVTFGSPRRYITDPSLTIISPAPMALAYGGLAAVDSNLRARYDDLYEAGFTRELRPGTHVDVDAQYWRLGSTIDDRFCTDDLRRCLTNIPSARREISSLTSSFQSMHNFRRGDVQWGARYVWSRRTGNVDAPDIMLTRYEGPDPYSRIAFDSEQTTPPNGPLANDRRHDASAYANVSYRRFHASAKATWMSGAPRFQFGFSDLYGRYAHYLSAPGALGRTPSVFDAFTELSYDIKSGSGTTRVGINVDHLFDRQTPLTEDYRFDFSGGVRNPTFLQPMTRVDPRTVRLFVRFRI